MKENCAREEKEIQDLPNTTENSEKLKELQHKFTLVVSADY